MLVSKHIQWPSNKEKYNHKNLLTRFFPFAHLNGAPSLQYRSDNIVEMLGTKVNIVFQIVKELFMPKVANRFKRIQTAQDFENLIQNLYSIFNGVYCKHHKDKNFNNDLPSSLGKNVTTEMAKAYNRQYVENNIRKYITFQKVQQHLQIYN
jgi:hypothetical protein